MADKAEALATLESEYSKFRALIAGLPDSAYGETWLGTWNLSQLLAHMAGWYREMSGAINRVARGEPATPPGVDYNDADAWNVKFAELAKPGRTALTDWDEAFQGYRDAAAALDAGHFGIDPEKNRPRIGNRLLQGAGIGHFEEHTEDLQRWLSSRPV